MNDTSDNTLAWSVEVPSEEASAELAACFARVLEAPCVIYLRGDLGAGKTTFLSILGGTVTKTSGSVNVWGFNLDKNPRQVKASLGIVPQEINLDPFFNPRQLLELQAGLYGVDGTSPAELDAAQRRY